jgi:hypothetical protein
LGVGRSSDVVWRHEPAQERAVGDLDGVLATEGMAAEYTRGSSRRARAT